jgi:hypothetical protein
MYYALQIIFTSNIAKFNSKFLRLFQNTNCAVALFNYPGSNIEVPLYTVCPTRYRTQHFFINSNTNEDIATKFEQGYVHCVRNEEEYVCSVRSKRVNSLGHGTNPEAPRPSIRPFVPP